MPGTKLEKQGKKKEKKSVRTADMKFLKNHTAFPEEDIQEWFAVFLKVP